MTFYIALVLVVFGGMVTSVMAQTQSALPLQTPRGSATYGPQGETYQTFSTPDGGSVTYTPQGEAYRTYRTPAGGAVTYGPHGERFETVPTPSDKPDQERSRD